LINDNLRVVFIAFFAGIFVFGLIFVIFSFITVSCNKMGLRYIAHLAWNVMSIITLLLYILAAVFLVISFVFTIVPRAFTILTDKDGIAVLFKDDQQIQDIMLSCFQGDGDLSKVLMKTDSLKDFDKYYDASFKLSEINDQLKASADSKMATEWKEIYRQIPTNLAKDNSTDINSGLRQLEMMTSYTAKSSQFSRVGDCSSKADDFWVTDNNACLNNTAILSPADPTSNYGKKQCLNFNEWGAASVASRYNGKPKCPNVDVPAEISAIVNSLKAYGPASDQPLNNLRTDLDEINASYRTVSTQIIGDLSKAERVFDPLVSIMKDFAGKEGISGLVSCKFVQNNLKQLFTVMDDSVPVTTNIGAALAALAVLNWFVLFFGLAYLFRHISAQSGNQVDDLEPQNNGDNKIEVN
jgi:hypothetical protein